jgi:hypothetical protein
MTVPKGAAITSPARSTAPARVRDKRHLGAALAISAAVYLGFWFTYFGPNLRGTYPATSAAVHLHGWSFFAWYLLLPLQASLIHARRVRLHRTLGWLSIALASLMVASGLLVIGVRMAEAVASREPSFWSMFGPMIAATLVLFAGFYAAAVVRRRVSASHKRLVLVASAAGMGAAAFRIIGALWGQVLWAVPAGILASNVFIVAGMAYDYVRDRRVHPAFQIGLLVCLGVEVGVWLLTPTSAGRAVAHGLAWVGHTAGFLY